MKDFATKHAAFHAEMFQLHAVNGNSNLWLAQKLRSLFLPALFFIIPEELLIFEPNAPFIYGLEFYLFKHTKNYNMHGFSYKGQSTFVREQISVW